MDPVKILSEKVIHTADLFHINQVNLEFPNGVKKTWENVVRDDAISVIPIAENGEIILVKQYRYLHKSFMIEACAGFIEAGEEPLSAARRELQEETGFSAQEIQLLTNVLPASSIVKWSQFVYYARGLQKGKTRFDDLEDISLIQLTLEKAIEKIFSQEIRNGPTITGIFMLDKMRREGKL